MSGAGGSIISHALALGVAAFAVSLAFVCFMGGVVWSAPPGGCPRRAIMCFFSAPLCVAIAFVAGDLASRLP